MEHLDGADTYTQGLKAAELALEGLKDGPICMSFLNTPPSREFGFGFRVALNANLSGISFHYLDRGTLRSIGGPGASYHFARQDLDGNIRGNKPGLSGNQPVPGGRENGSPAGAGQD